MVKLIIDQREVLVEEGTTILDAAASVGIHIPKLCFLKDINEIGACRVCCIEIEGIDKLITSCNNVVEEGMVVHTNSPRVREARRINMELILSKHDCYCPTCVRSGNCSLQSIANDLGILEVPYKRKLDYVHDSNGFALVRNDAKCIKCMRCVQICDKVQSLGVWDVIGTGSRTTVGVSHHRDLWNTDCSLCGQCITHCPTGALRERDDTDKVFDAIADPEKITVVQIAPSVRAAWGEGVGLTKEEATVRRMVASVRKLGFNYVFDTDFSADLTIMEEGNEFLHRLKTGGTLPMFTSCCPGWVRFLKSQYPELTPNLSTAKSPQQMFGAVAKSYYADLLGVSPDKIFSVSIMPCLAKKHECAIPVMNDACGDPDVDVVLTTREIDRMLRSDHILPALLEEEDFDTPLGIGSGAGVIFGATGGVMEAALRTAYFVVTGQNPDPDAFFEVRGLKGWKEATFSVGGTDVRVAVASGLANARDLVEAVLRKEVQYDFIEIMACPGGCVGGGGQPIHESQELAEERGQILYGLDKRDTLRFSHENPSIIRLYEDYMGEPLGHKAHHLLHTDHDKWEMPKAPARD